MNIKAKTINFYWKSNQSTTKTGKELKVIDFYKRETEKETEPETEWALAKAIQKLLPP